MIDCQARISFIDGDSLRVISGVVSRHDGDQMTVRALPTGASHGALGVVAVRAPDGDVYRARAHIESHSDLSIDLVLHESLSVAERRMYARATVAARLRCRRTQANTALHVVGPDNEDDWLIEVIELSPSGMLAPLPGEWSVGESVLLDLHIPGPYGGERMRLAGEIARVFPERPIPAAAIQFQDLSHRSRERLAAVVDLERLGIQI